MLKLAPYEIESYLDSKGLQYRRRGQKAELKLCPFCNGGKHNDVWKCVVYLDDDGGNYKCMRGTCDESGSFWQLAEHFGDDPKEFYQRDENDFKVENNRIVQELKPKITFKTEKVEPHKLTEQAQKYLATRGFALDVLDELPLWCDEQGNINFGYYHKSELCMTKVRKAGKFQKGVDKAKAWQKWSGGLRTLWLLELADLSVPVLVITFGEYDAIALRQARVGNVVSVPCGDQDLEWINTCYDELKDLKEIYLWIDNDESGRKALPKIAKRLGESRLKVIDSEYKDANEFLHYETKKNGQEQAERDLYRTVLEAKWYYKGDISQFCDIEEGETSFEGYNSGIKALDKSLGGFLEGRLTVHTGNTKAGKSTIINQLVAQSIAQGGIGCVWSGEDELSEYKYKMSVHLAGYEGTIQKTSRAGAQYSVVIDEYKNKINDYTFNKLFVISKKSGLTEDNLIENFQLAFERFGCDVFVVDNLMKLVASKDTQNLNFRQTQVVNKLSDFCKETNTHIHLVTHTSKQDADEKPPSKVNDVSGAKEIVNLCDSLVSWWRVPENMKGMYDEADTLGVILANRVFGDKGTVTLKFDPRIKSFAEDITAMRDLRYAL